MQPAKSLKGSVGWHLELRVQQSTREDGGAVERPKSKGAVTYTADGRFHFITVRSDAPKYASGDLRVLLMKRLWL